MRHAINPWYSTCACHADDLRLLPGLGYTPSAAKTVDEYATLDAEDESLARWKASLGIVPGAPGAAADGPKVRRRVPHLDQPETDELVPPQVTVLALELHSPTLPAGKLLSMELAKGAQLETFTIKEGVEYK